MRRLVPPLICLTLTPCFLLAQNYPLRVVTTEPSANVVGFERFGPLSITFNMPVDRESLTDTSFQVFGQW
jgi:hypothetical protein